MTAGPIPVPADLPQQAAQTTAENPWPLRLLSAKIAEYVAKMSRLWVEGEIITLVRRPNAKMQFFTLADLEDKAAINVKILSHNLPAGLESGARVVVCAKPDFWTGNGSLSLYADEVRPVGIGDILARIEALKAKLASEGLFAAARKKPLPFLPRKIGLICGRNTKAKHDVVVNATARWAAAQFEIREVQVQGEGSVPQMIAALNELDAIREVDVIVLARGGGSVEDLLPFSDERLVRAAAQAQTPIVSAIGHETDSPVLDLVADFRASTPTDAARRIVPDVNEERVGIAQARERIRQALENRLVRSTSDIAALRSRPVLAHPELLLDSRVEELANLRAMARTYMEYAYQNSQGQISALTDRLRALSPLATLNRGYAILQQDSGEIISNVSRVEVGSAVVARVSDGAIALTVAGVKSQDPPMKSSAERRK
ncbi:MAG: exodeoxyribonuclease VII large subunit [Trueperella sp.]|nr:exodeoxyribonuclease VII large subunit [Trueperella sp.]